MGLVGRTHPVLLRRAVDVAEDADVTQIARRLIATLARHPNGVALAAPQVGVGQRLVAMNLGIPVEGLAGNRVVLVNPTVVVLDPESMWETGPEGCLSLPGHAYEVARSVRVGVQADVIALGPGGALRLQRAVKWRPEGFPARVVQHEVDHLDGVLISSKGREVRTSAGTMVG